MLAITLLNVFAFSAGDAPLGEAGIDKSITINAPLANVWNAWTTEDGAAFVAGTANIELREGGPYEWFLQLDPDENGKRGSEGSRVLNWEHERRLVFSWTYPPDVPELRSRNEFMTVVVELDEGDGGVDVRLRVYGFQNGDAYDRGRDYFDVAWGYVLDKYKSQLESG